MAQYNAFYNPAVATACGCDMKQFGTQVNTLQQRMIMPREATSPILTDLIASSVIGDLVKAGALMVYDEAQMQFGVHEKYAPVLSVAVPGNTGVSQYNCELEQVKITALSASRLRKAYPISLSIKECLAALQNTNFSTSQNVTEDEYRVTVLQLMQDTFLSINNSCALWGSFGDSQSGAKFTYFDGFFKTMKIANETSYNSSFSWELGSGTDFTLYGFGHGKNFTKTQLVEYLSDVTNPLKPTQKRFFVSLVGNVLTLTANDNLEVIRGMDERNSIAICIGFDKKLFCDTQIKETRVQNSMPFSIRPNITAWEQLTISNWQARFGEVLLDMVNNIVSNDLQNEKFILFYDPTYVQLSNIANFLRTCCTNIDPKMVDGLVDNVTLLPLAQLSGTSVFFYTAANNLEYNTDTGKDGRSVPPVYMDNVLDCNQIKFMINVESWGSVSIRNPALTGGTLQGYPAYDALPTTTLQVPETHLAMCPELLAGCITIADNKYKANLKVAKYLNCAGGRTYLQLKDATILQGSDTYVSGNVDVTLEDSATGATSVVALTSATAFNQLYQVPLGKSVLGVTYMVTTSGTTAYAGQAVPPVEFTAGNCDDFKTACITSPDSNTSGSPILVDALLLAYAAKGVVTASWVDNIDGKDSRYKVQYFKVLPTANAGDVVVDGACI